MSTLFINGQHVHIGLVVQNVLWIVGMISAFPLLVIVFRRLYAIRQMSRSRTYHPVTIHWVHIAICYACLVAVGVDLTHAFFDDSILVTWAALSEGMIVFAGALVYYILSHVKTYVQSQKLLHSPKWIVKMRRAWLAANFALGTAIVAAAFVLESVVLVYLTQLYVCIQSVVFSIILFVIVRKLGRVINSILSTSGAGDMSSVRRRMRQFNRRSLISAVISMVYGLALGASFYLNMASIDFDLTVRFDEDPNFVRNRDGHDEFAFLPLSWFGFVLLFYSVRIFWIDKSVVQSYHRSKSGGNGAGGRARKGTDTGTGTGSGTPAASGFRNPSRASQSGGTGPCIELASPSRASTTASVASLHEDDDEYDTSGGGTFDKQGNYSNYSRTTREVGDETLSRTRDSRELFTVTSESAHLSSWQSTSSASRSNGGGEGAAFRTVKEEHSKATNSSVYSNTHNYPSARTHRSSTPPLNGGLRLTRDSPARNGRASSSARSSNARSSFLSRDPPNLPSTSLLGKALPGSDLRTISSSKAQTSFTTASSIPAAGSLQERRHTVSSTHNASQNSRSIAHSNAKRNSLSTIPSNASHNSRSGVPRFIAPSNAKRNSLPIAPSNSRFIAPSSVSNNSRPMDPSNASHNSLSIASSNASHNSLSGAPSNSSRNSRFVAPSSAKRNSLPAVAPSNASHNSRFIPPSSVSNNSRSMPVSDSSRNLRFVAPSNASHNSRSNSRSIAPFNSSHNSRPIAPNSSHNSRSMAPSNASHNSRSNSRSVTSPGHLPSTRERARSRPAGSGRPNSSRPRAATVQFPPIIRPVAS